MCGPSRRVPLPDRAPARRRRFDWLDFGTPSLECSSDDELRERGPARTLRTSPALFTDIDTADNCCATIFCSVRNYVSPSFPGSPSAPSSWLAMSPLRIRHSRYIRASPLHRSDTTTPSVPVAASTHFMYAALSSRHSLKWSSGKTPFSGGLACCCEVFVGAPNAIQAISGGSQALTSLSPALPLFLSPSLPVSLSSSLPRSGWSRFESVDTHRLKTEGPDSRVPCGHSNPPIHVPDTFRQRSAPRTRRVEGQVEKNFFFFLFSVD